MPKLIVSIDGIVIKEVQLTKDRTTLGRRPYNDVVIDNLAVSGEHAVVQMVGSEVSIEDLNSTNGTYLNGKVIKKQVLKHLDQIEIGKYRIQFQQDDGSDGFAQTMVYRAPVAPAPAVPTPPTTPPTAPPPPPPPPLRPAAASHGTGLGLGQAAIKVLSGAAAGREVRLVKVVTTIGKPGVAVAAITHRPQGYVAAHVEGATRATLNGDALGDEPVALRHGDLLELAGAQMQFIAL